MRGGKGGSKPAGGSAVIQIAQCFEAGAVLYQRVTLQGVRMLALSKATKMPGGEQEQGQGQVEDEGQERRGDAGQEQGQEQ